MTITVNQSQDKILRAIQLLYTEKLLIPEFNEYGIRQWCGMENTIEILRKALNGESFSIKETTKTTLTELDSISWLNGEDSDFKLIFNYSYY
ncbi:MAG: hypothetical protein JEY91_11890 [Spirochaetaceae bacterium]|nr:hypothetical protein [Spirochaetaceae bacterium]